MSAEEFEILESKERNESFSPDEPNESNDDEEKDMSSDPLNDALNDDIISPNLISSHALLTNSEPVSLASSHSNASQLQSQSQSQLMSPLNNQHLNNEIIEPASNNIQNNNNNNSETDTDDMNLEQTPPINKNICQQSAVMVNHQINDNDNDNDSNDNHNFSEKHYIENKEKEELQIHKIPIEGRNNNNMPPKEGSNHNNDNNVPIVSNIDNVTPNHERKIYNNPYYNGSKSTPGGDDDNNNNNIEGGEESDDIDIDDDESDHIISQPKFTIGDDQSDEEKDDIIPHNNKPKNIHKNQPPIIHINKNNDSYVNLSMILFAIVSVFISYYYTYYQTTHSAKPEPPKFHCPSSLIYVPMDGNSFYINASHMDHPENTQYEWDVTNEMQYDDLFIAGENTFNLLLMKGTSPGHINIELYISYTFSNLYMFNKQCSVNVIFHESPYFGIDLGTTYSCIAYQQKQRAESKTRDIKIIVADKHRAEYCIPTAIYFPPNSSPSQQVIIGEDALKKLASDPLNVIFDIKRIVGRHCTDPEIETFIANHVNINITCENEDNIRIWIPNLNDFIAPEQALSVILGHLVEIASLEFGVPYIGDIVVSIPALFHNGQRKAIHSACSLVGLNVVQLVVEPTAAALAYSYYSSTPADNFKLFLTFDFGGGTIDCSVMRCTGVECQVIGVMGNSSLGGIDFDYIIRDIMIDKYEMQHGWSNISESRKLAAKFLVVAEQVKKSLSISTQHQVTMTNDELSVTEKKQVVITRREFEENWRTKELIDSAIETAKSAINTDSIKASNIRMILMVGGTTKIPIIQQRLQEEFGLNNSKLKLVFPTSDAQLMVVRGSAIIGGSLAFDGEMNKENALKNIVLEDVIPLSLGFSICYTNFNQSGQSKCGLMDVIIQKNSHYPTRAKTIYCQKDPNSSIAKLDLYEGDSHQVKDNYLLSHLSIRNIPKRQKNICNSIIVEFIIDKNGIASIQAIANNTSFSNTLPVVSTDGSLSIKDIKILKTKMISWFQGHESIQNALLQQK